MLEKKKNVTRRDFLKIGGLGMVGLAGTGGAASVPIASANQALAAPAHTMKVDESHNSFGTMGEIDHEANGFHPMEILYDFDYGEVKQEGGRTVREWQFFALDREFDSVREHR